MFQGSQIPILKHVGFARQPPTCGEPYPSLGTVGSKRTRSHETESTTVGGGWDKRKIIRSKLPWRWGSWFGHGTQWLSFTCILQATALRKVIHQENYFNPSIYIYTYTHTRNIPHDFEMAVWLLCRLPATSLNSNIKRFKFKSNCSLQTAFWHILSINAWPELFTIF